MKAERSRGKLVYAYQQTPLQASNVNNHIDGYNNGDVVIRVVEPRGNLPFRSVNLVNYADDSTGRLSSRVDHLVGATVTKTSQKSSHSSIDAPATVSLIPNGSVSSITHIVLPQGHKVIDISLNIRTIPHLIAQEEAVQGLPTMATIFLEFESGASDTLLLNLLPSGNCNLIIDPSDLCGDMMGVSTFSSETGHPGYTAFMHTKSFSSNTEKYQIGNQTVNFPFSAPWGFAVDDPVLFTTHDAKFVTETRSNLFWTSGRDDMSHLWPGSTSTYSLYTAPNVAASGAEGIDFGEFFKFKAFKKAENSFSAITSEDLSRSWGHSYGWLCAMPADSTLYNVNNLTSSTSSTGMWGIPGSPTQSGGWNPGGTNAANVYTLDAAWSGGSQVSVAGSGDTPTAYQFGLSMFARKRRSQLIAQANVYGYASYADNPHNIQNFSMGNIVSTGGHVRSTKNGGLTSAGTCYATGSVAEIQVNSGKNFFYPSGPVVNGGVITPTFKSIARTTFISDGPLVGIVKYLANIPTNTEPGKVVNNKGVYECAASENSMNPIDLMASLLYSSLLYPLNEEASFGQGAYESGLPYPLESSTTFADIGSKILGGAGYSFSDESIGGPVTLTAQDIVMLTSEPVMPSEATSSPDALRVFHPLGDPFNVITSVSDENISPSTHPNYLKEVHTLSAFDCDGSYSGFTTMFGNSNLSTMVWPYANRTVPRSADYTYASKYAIEAPTYVSADSGSAAYGNVPSMPIVSLLNNLSTTPPIGSNGCFNILSSSVEVTNLTNDETLLPQGADAGFPSTDGNKYLQLKYKLQYTNLCGGSEFSTSSGDKTVKGGDLAFRVAGVLDIFPRIEYSPLSALGPSPLAYTIIVEDENDVDDISIINLTGDTYELEVTIIADTTDTYDAPGDGSPEATIEYTDIFPDVLYQIADVTGGPVSNDSSWTSTYKDVQGDADVTTFKSSFFRVSTVADWETRGFQSSTTTASMDFVHHTPFITYGERDDSDIDVPDAVPGCTDSEALNYDSAATVANGSCTYCTDYFNEIGGGTNSAGIGGNLANMVSVGVFGEGYVAGVIGGGSSVNLYEPSSNTEWTNYPISGTTSWIQGGMTMSTSTELLASGDVKLSLKQDYGESLSSFLAEFSNLGTAIWELKIYAPEGEILTTIDWDNPSYAETDGYYAPDLGSPLYTGSPTGGNMQHPEWVDISTAASGIGLLAGAPYIIQITLKSDLFPAGCNLFTQLDHSYLGVFWVGFCGCHLPSNRYSITGYPWNSAGGGLSTFPALEYGTGACTSVGHTGDDYTLSDSTNATCFLVDDQLSSCDDYWLYCVESTEIVCDVSASMEEMIDLGEGILQYPFSGSISTNITGFYNPGNNSYMFNSFIAYSITVENTSGSYNETQSQLDGAPSGSGLNSFIGITEPGMYTVTFTMTGPYLSDYTGSRPCVFTETVEITNTCLDGAVGCTDQNAENFDVNAIFSDDSCTYINCEDFYDNPNLSFTLASTNSTSTCATDTITFQGVNYTVEVPQPGNDGTILVTPTFEDPAIINYAVAYIVPDYTTIANISSLQDAIYAVTGSFPTSTSGTTPLGTFGMWSPLLSVATDTTYTFSVLPPGVYTIFVVPLLSNMAAIPAECTGQALIDYEQSFSTVTVGLDDAGCEQPCIGGDCDEVVQGCSDPNADNYNASATYDDGSCTYPQGYCETNPNDPLCLDCSGTLLSETIAQKSGSLDSNPCDPIVGVDGECTDPNACNYNPDAPLNSANNLLCEYCSCAPADDPDCFQDSDCDPALDPHCQPPQAECPDPGNPNCDPDIYNPCPLPTDCQPPGDPCLYLGNCPEGPEEPNGDTDTFDDEVIPYEVTCGVDVEGIGGFGDNFAAVQQKAFQCMSEEGKRLLFKIKAGVECSKEDITKLSLVSYLFMGGTERGDLPCLWNCNYDSKDKAKANNCVSNWVSKGAKVYNGIDSYKKGDTVLYYYLNNGRVKRSYYAAHIDIVPGGLHPRYPQSGFHRCKDISVRTSDVHGIATGKENYLQVMWEFLTRYCTSCDIGDTSISTPDIINNVDPKNLPSSLPLPTTTKSNNPSGILGEDGDEIIF
jgi:hypothetical protein